MRDLLFPLVVGAPSGIWPPLLLPLLGILIANAVASRVEPLRTNIGILALLALTPGLTCLGYLVTAMRRGAFHVDTHSEGLLFVAIKIVPLAAVAITVLAMLSLLRQIWILRRIVDRGSAASGDLLDAANDAGVRIVELRHGRGVLFACGLFRSTVVISSDIVEQLSPVELRAALHHERSHLDHRDPALLTAMSFVMTVYPLRTLALVKLGRALERRADEEAVTRCDRLDLAAALLKLSRGTTAEANSKLRTYARPDGGWRVEALLADEGRTPLPRLSVIDRLGIAACLMLTIAPVSQHLLGRLIFG